MPLIDLNFNTIQGDESARDLARRGSNFPVAETSKSSPLFSCHCQTTPERRRSSRAARRPAAAAAQWAYLNCLRAAGELVSGLCDDKKRPVPLANSIRWTPPAGPLTRFVSIDLESSGRIANSTGGATGRLLAPFGPKLDRLRARLTATAPVNRPGLGRPSRVALKALVRPAGRQVAGSN